MLITCKRERKGENKKLTKQKDRLTERNRRQKKELAREREGETETDMEIDRWRKKEGRKGRMSIQTNKGEEREGGRVRVRCGEKLVMGDMQTKSKRERKNNEIEVKNEQDLKQDGDKEQGRKIQ